MTISKLMLVTDFGDFPAPPHLARAWQGMKLRKDGRPDKRTNHAGRFLSMEADTIGLILADMAIKHLDAEDGITR